MEYIRDRDRNTRFFHLRTIVRRRKNRIEGLQNGDREWLMTPEEIKAMVVAFFNKLLMEDSNKPCHMDLPAHSLNRLTVEQTSELNKPFTTSVECLEEHEPFQSPRTRRLPSKVFPTLLGTY